MDPLQNEALILEIRDALRTNSKLIFNKTATKETSLAQFRFLGMLSRIQDISADLEKNKQLSASFLEEIEETLDIGQMYQLTLDLFRSIKNHRKETASDLWYELYCNLGAAYILEKQTILIDLIETICSHIETSPREWEHLSDFAEKLHILYPAKKDILTNKLVKTTIFASILETPEERNIEETPKSKELLEKLKTTQGEYVPQSIYFKLEAVASDGEFKENTKIIVDDEALKIIHYHDSNGANILVFESALPNYEIKVSYNNESVTLSEDDGMIFCKFKLGIWSFNIGKTQIKRVYRGYRE